MKKFSAKIFLGAVIYGTFVLGVMARADEPQAPPPKQVKTVYPGKTELDFEGTQIDGEIRNPGEFYFEHRPEEKFDSLVKRRKNFHQEMLRDAVLSK
jgi:hypothetical protein